MYLQWKQSTCTRTWSLGTCTWGSSTCTCTRRQSTWYISGIWFSWWHCHPTTSASVKSRMVYCSGTGTRLPGYSQTSGHKTAVLVVIVVFRNKRDLFTEGRIRQHGILYYMARCKLQASVLSKRLDRSSWLSTFILPSAYPNLRCNVIRLHVSPKITLLPSGSLSQADWAYFPRSSDSNLVRPLQLSASLKSSITLSATHCLQHVVPNNCDAERRTI